MTARHTALTALSLLVMAATLLSAPLARAGGDVAPVAAPAPVDNKFVGWWELGGYYGTDESSRGEIVLFTPLAQSATTIFFLDARGKFFEDDVHEANLALGYRKMMPSGWNIGVWGGWDIRDTTNDNTFNQISFGFEALSERYDVRVNGYVPLEDSKGVSDTNSFEALLQGNNILVQGTNTDIDELAFYGVDAEFGILLFGGNRGGGGSKGAPVPAGRHELRAYAGGFYFDNDDADDAVAGPKGRLEYRINNVISSLPGSRLTIESELSYDEVRDTKFEIGARIRIPFGARGSDATTRTAALTGQELRMIEGLERDTDIVTNEETEVTVTTEGAIDDATDVALDNVSFAKTADQFAKAVNDGGNRLIILQKGNKRIDVSATDGQQLQDNQTVQGGASTILIRGKKTGEVVPFTAPGKRPTVFSNDTNAFTGIITVANNTHVAGLQFRGVGGVGAFVAGNNGIRGLDNLNNVVLEQLDIRNTGADAITFDDNNSNLKVWNVDIDNIGNSGFDIGSNNIDIALSDIQISDTGDAGLFLGSNNKKVNVTNARLVRTSGAGGIVLQTANENYTFDGVTIISSDSAGIDIGQDNVNIKILNSTITDPDDNGIDIGSSNSNILIADTTITGGPQIMRDGIEISSENSITIERVQISNAGDDGIEASGLNVLSITDVTISDVGVDGLQINGNNNTVTMNTTTFSGTFGDDVIDINASGNTLDGTNNVFNGTFGDQFCEVIGAQTGSFGFPGGPSNCPP